MRSGLALGSELHYGHQLSCHVTALHDSSARGSLLLAAGADGALSKAGAVPDAAASAAAARTLLQASGSAARVAGLDFAIIRVCDGCSAAVVGTCVWHCRRGVR